MRMTLGLPAAVLALALAAAGCGGAAPGGAQPVPPELRLDEVRFRIYRGDVLRSYGESDEVSLQRDTAEVRARRLEATLPRAGTPVRITAPAGEGSLLARTFEATGGVVVARGDDAARTDRATYVPEGARDGLVRGDGPVVVSGRGYRLTGTGFTLDPAAGTIVVRRGARLVTGLREAR
jgi:lipopolysaccharide export system protein LptC